MTSIYHSNLKNGEHVELFEEDGDYFWRKDSGQESISYDDEEEARSHLHTATWFPM